MVQLMNDQVMNRSLEKGLDVQINNTGSATEVVSAITGDNSTSI
jgi:hypothetical protein